MCASKASKQGKGGKTPGYLRPQAPLEDGSAYVCGKCGKKEKAAYVQQVGTWQAHAQDREPLLFS